MSRVIIQSSLGAQLSGIKETVVLEDETGRRLGKFTPEPLCPWDPSLTLEEADRIVDETEGYTLEEIMRELEHK
jgi:hypothetical protein